MTTDKSSDELEFIDSDKINSILKDPKNLQFKYLLVKTISRLSEKDFLEKKDVFDEINRIENTSIKPEDYDFDYDEISLYGKLIGEIDASRSRLSDLYSRSQMELNFIEEHYSSLLGIWSGNYSKLSSKDKREGEAMEILYFLLDEKIERKAIYNIIKNKFNLMNAKLDSLSRRVTIKSESMKHFPGQDDIHKHKLSRINKPDGEKNSYDKAINFMKKEKTNSSTVEEKKDSEIEDLFK